MQRLLVGEDIFGYGGEAYDFQRIQIRLRRTARDGQPQPFGAGHGKEATPEVRQRAFFRQRMNVRRMRDSCEQAPSRSEHTGALVQGVLQAASRQLVQEHAGEDKINGSVIEREWLLHVQCEILGVIGVMLCLSDGEQLLRLVGDEQTRWRLAREAPQHEWSKVAIAGAQFEDGLPGNAANLAQEAVVEHMALERAAVVPRGTVPPLSDAVVVSDPRYRLVPFSSPNLMAHGSTVAGPAPGAEEALQYSTRRDARAYRIGPESPCFEAEDAWLLRLTTK
jgi:hypothetical protein